MVVKYLNSVDKKASFFVYRLIDPRNNIVKYIGITKSISERLRKHLSSKSRTLKNNWIKSLLKKDLKPICQVIDYSFTREDVNIKEKYWIIKHKEWGFDLLNMTDGGDGGNTFQGKKHTIETIQKIRNSKIGKKRSINNKSKRKKVAQICPKTGCFINFFESVVSASNLTGSSKTNIAKYCNGSIKKSIKLVNGFKWKYIN
jgi:hypothetical protein